MHLLTWNVQWCCGLDGVCDPSRIIDEVHAMGPCDVLCLQEIAVGFPALRGQPGHQVEQLKALLPGWSVFFGAAVDDLDAQGRHRFGNLIASRLPVRHIQHFPLPYPPDPGVQSMQRMCSVLTVVHPGLGPVRIMTAHLEYFSSRQRRAQLKALRALHLQQSGLARLAPAQLQDGTPYQVKAHTPHAVLCGDFNFQPEQAEYELLAAPLSAQEARDSGFAEGTRLLQDAWCLAHPGRRHEASFCLYEREFSPQPVCSDYLWVSESLAGHVGDVRVNTRTQASDHQPMQLMLHA